MTEADEVRAARSEDRYPVMMALGHEQQIIGDLEQAVRENREADDELWVRYGWAPADGRRDSCRTYGCWLTTGHLGRCVTP